MQHRDRTRINKKGNVPVIVTTPRDVKFVLRIQPLRERRAAAVPRWTAAVLRQEIIG